ncbi:MAG: carboxypeptidase regulatory-like domain-containing protein [Armatimonadetes bacterium]|nr:carboxypeptidase regulatory-like domain-containing protein [Armatimonadota bacterium]
MFTLRKNWSGFGAALTMMLLIAGCGGDTTKNTAIVSGRVTFVDGLPVRGATVKMRDNSAVSGTNGAYVIENVRASDQLVTATYSEGGTDYVGSNLARTYEGEQDQNINIVMVPEDQTASVEGYVFDRQGAVLELAEVFAFGDGYIGSSKVVTDKNGYFKIDRLMAGIPYTVQANTGGYRSDTDFVTLHANEKVRLDFTMGSTLVETLPQPKNVGIIAWTSPVTRDQKMISGLEAIKRMLSPRRASLPATRLSSLGNPVEMEIEWDPIPTVDLLGYDIYRAANSTNYRSYDFFREPLGSVYIDSDTGLTPGIAYSYKVAATSPDYPYYDDTEGPQSDPVTATPLNDLVLRQTLTNPLTFRWNSVTSADGYYVYLFDRYPGDGVEKIWSNTQAVTGVELQYNGNVALQNGRTYYFIVIGTTSDQISRTLSEIGSFVYQD